jgi:hypothetical protein
MAVPAYPDRAFGLRRWDVGLVILRRWRLWAAAAVVVVVLGLGVWLLWPSPPPPRARPYLDWTACLLTDGQGTGGPQAAAVWAGMQDASSATHARVQYVAVAGGASTGDALPYLAGLLQRQCAVVVAVGDAQVAAVATDAPRYPAVRFVVVGGSASGGNVTVLNGFSGPQLRDRIRALVVDAVHAAAPR